MINVTMNKRINGRIILIAMKFSVSISPMRKIEEIGARSWEVGNVNHKEDKKLKTKEKVITFKSLLLNNFLNKDEIINDRKKYINQAIKII